MPDLGQKWHEVDAGDSKLQYLQISGPKNYEMKSSDNFSEYKFWNSINFGGRSNEPECEKHSLWDSSKHSFCMK